MKIAVEIDGTSYSSEGDDIFDALTEILIEAGHMDKEFFLTAMDAEESAILNLSS